MAVGISRSIGIGMKKCCGGGVITPPPPSPFPLRFINTANVPPPSGCDVFDASISITRNGTTFLASEMTKTSNNTSTTTVDPISVYATDIVEVTMEAITITDPACSSSANTTTTRMAVGNAFNASDVATVTSNDSPPTATYQFSPVQGSLDVVNIKGSSSYVAPPSTFTVTLGSSQPTNTPSCTTFDLEIRVYDSQGGNLVATETATKISNNNPTISNPQITVSPGYYIECIVTSQAPGNVTCQQTWTGTDVFLETGSGGALTKQLTVQSLPVPPNPAGSDFVQATYAFSPVQGTDDEINIYSVG